MSQVEAAPRITAIVVTYNSSKTIENCIRSLHPASRGTRPHAAKVCDVIVVDNASSDDTVAKVHGLGFDTSVLANVDNVGLAAANNQGMLSAPAADAFLICNPDTILGPGALEAMSDCLRRRPRAAFVIPKIFNSDGSLQPCVGALPTLRIALRGHADSLASAGDADSDAMWWSAWGHDTERRVPRGLEACYLIRASAVAEVGIQDPKFFLDWEGVDWTRRMTQARWQVWFTPTAQVTHVGSVSISQARWSAIRYSHYGMFRYFALSAPLWQLPILAAMISTRALLKAGVALARGLSR